MDSVNAIVHWQHILYWPKLTVKTFSVFAVPVSSVSVVIVGNLKHDHEFVITDTYLFFCRANCSFYFKIGACRHGDRCSRMHNRPTYGQTILLQNLFLNPQHSATTQSLYICIGSAVVLVFIYSLDC